MKNLNLFQGSKIRRKVFRKSHIFRFIMMFSSVLPISCASGVHTNSIKRNSGKDSEIVERNKIFGRNKISESKFDDMYGVKTSSPYIIQIVEDGVGLGSKDFRIGKKTYNHLITIGLNCEKDDSFFSSTSVSFKDIKWQVTEKLKGNATTDSDGYFKIFFNDASEQVYERLFLQYKKKEYIVNLPAYKKVKIDIDDCL